MNENGRGLPWTPAATWSSQRSSQRSLPGWCGGSWSVDLDMMKHVYLSGGSWSADLDMMKHVYLSGGSWSADLDMIKTCLFVQALWLMSTKSFAASNPDKQFFYSNVNLNGTTNHTIPLEKRISREDRSFLMSLESPTCQITTKYWLPLLFSLCPSSLCLLVANTTLFYCCPWNLQPVK